MSKTKEQNLTDIGNGAMSSIREMVAALQCDYDRLEELRELRDTKKYVAGWNMPGCLPDRYPAEFDCFDDAKQYIIDAIEGAAAEDEDEDAAETLCALAEDVNLESEPFSYATANRCYWVTQDGNMLSPEEAEELEELEEAAGECSSEEEARERIQEDPLSLEFRSGWSTDKDDLQAEEFCLLLATGGPSVRIVGEISDGEAKRAWLEVQDWGTPWTEHVTTGDDHDALMAYVGVFCFE